MKVYRRVWLVVCAATVGVGVGVGLVRSPATFSVMFIDVAVLTAIACLVAGCSPKRRRQASGRRLVGSALAGGAAAGAAVGLAELLGVGVVALGIVLLVTSPHVLRAYVRALTEAPLSMPAGLDVWVLPPLHAGPQIAPPSAVAKVHLLTDHRLRTAWRTSFLALQTRPQACEAAAIVAERQRYLDEFERRNPRGFEAWLARGARASDIPASSLREAPTTDPGINWDELTRQQDS